MAETVAKALLSGWKARFGCPVDIVTDRGAQFEYSFIQYLSRIIGFKHRRSTAYHPTSNGVIVRCHRQIKAAIMCHTDANCTESLPLVLFGIRSAFKKDLKTSSAEPLYGEPLRLPGEFFEELVKNTTDITDFSARIRLCAEKLQPVPGKEVTVLLDRLKPANTLADSSPSKQPTVKEPPTPPQIIKTTHTGRQVRFPNYYRPQRRSLLCPRLRPRRKVTLGSIFEHVEERPNLTSVVEDTAPFTFDNEAGNC
ncbi:hypothetical protein EVAR_87532_1 [Eumeta japonica]|uniref:Integrase catalytic domain-containing protein n=1 Tax=Eumeta variegata TaxID=151549 RepID=A0A4C1XNQ1_EUMVA|nr:hypothetical protein EVAR_87532_1 [Eumeta japonica]